MIFPYKKSVTVSELSDYITRRIFESGKKYAVVLVLGYALTWCIFGRTISTNFGTAISIIQLFFL